MARGILWIWLLASVGLLACGDIDRQPRYPNEQPTADLVVPAQVLVGQIVRLDGSRSTDLDGYIESYHFIPGESDEQLITAEPILEYVYSRSGDFIVTLTVVDDRGGTGSTTATITVLP